MTVPRKHIPPGAEAALWTLSNAQCYAPGCSAPVIVEVRPGVYRKNAQIAHIIGVAPDAPRYQPVPVDIRDGFGNLLLLCLPHHSEVDDRTTGARDYPVHVLQGWKAKHEGKDRVILARLGTVDEETLTRWLTESFSPPINRLEAIADRLEDTGRVTTDIVAELRQVTDIIAATRYGPDAVAAGAVAYAAEVFSHLDLRGVAADLTAAAEMFDGVNINGAASRLEQAAEALRSASDYL